MSIYKYFNKLIMILIIISSFIVLDFKTIKANESSSIEVVTCSIDSTGYVEVYGYIVNNDINVPLHNDICILLTTDDFGKLSDLHSDSIAYIDQKKLGNNDSFLFKFQVNDKFLDKPLHVNLGHSACKTFKSIWPIMTDGASFKLNNISNNSVIYGLDAYTLDSTYLTSTDVADSIIHGGNKIYYKFGNNWFDLLNENAIDNSYLVEKNALNLDMMKSLNLRYYYKEFYKFEFEK